MTEANDCERERQLGDGGVPSGRRIAGLPAMPYHHPSAVAQSVGGDLVCGRILDPMGAGVVSVPRLLIETLLTAIGVGVAFAAVAWAMMVPG